MLAITQAATSNESSRWNPLPLEGAAQLDGLSAQRRDTGEACYQFSIRVG
jgi:hypothetical protein